jgi:hypothetical protein
MPDRKSSSSSSKSKDAKVSIPERNIDFGINIKDEKS